MWHKFARKKMEEKNPRNLWCYTVILVRIQTPSLFADFIKLILDLILNKYNISYLKKWNILPIKPFKSFVTLHGHYLTQVSQPMNG